MMMDALRKRGVLVREARLAWGISLRTLAAEAGISPTYLSMIERGRLVPSEWRQAQLEELLERRELKNVKLAKPRKSNGSNGKSKRRK